MYFSFAVPRPFLRLVVLCDLSSAIRNESHGTNGGQYLKLGIHLIPFISYIHFKLSVTFELNL